MSNSASIATLGSGVVRFLHWWKRELTGIVPGFVRSIWRPKSVIVSVREQTVELLEARWRGPRVIASANFDDDQELTLLARRANRIAKARGARLALRLARGQCLVRHLSLPIATKSRLEAMVRLELERLLPNDASNFVFGWVARDSRAERGHLPVDLIVCKRSQLHSIVERLAAVRLRPDSIDCWQDGAGAFGVDLSKDLLGQARASGRLRTLKSALATTAAALILAAPFIWQAHRMAVLAALDTRIDAARSTFQSARAETERLGARHASAGALVQRRSEHPLMIELWAEIARMLPDDAYAEEISFDSGRLTIDGRAKSAAALVPVLELSPLLEKASLSSSVVLDPESGLERFTITLALEHGPTTAAIPAEGSIQ